MFPYYLVLLVLGTEWCDFLTLHVAPAETTAEVVFLLITGTKLLWICSACLFVILLFFFDMICNYAYCWKPGCSVYREAHILCLCFGHHFWGGTNCFWHKKYNLWKRKSPEKHARRNKNLCRCYIWYCDRHVPKIPYLGYSFQSCLTISCNPILHVVFYHCSEQWIIFTADILTYALHTLTRRIKCQNPLFDSYSVPN